MNGRISHRIGVLLVVLAACPMAWAADSTGAARVGQRAPALALKDRQGEAFSLATPRTAPLVLVFAGQSARAEAREWARSIGSLLAEGASFTACTVMQPREGFGRGGGPGGGGPGGRGPGGPGPGGGGPGAGMHALVDSGGAVGARWIGLAATEPAVVVISSDNVVRAIISGPASEANVQQLRLRIAALQPASR